MSGFRLDSDFSQVFVWLPPFESADFAFLTDSGKLEYERKTLTLWFQQDWEEEKTELFKIKKEKRSSPVQAQISSIISNNSKGNTITGGPNCFLFKCSLFKMYPSVKVPL